MMAQTVTRRVRVASRAAALAAGGVVLVLLAVRGPLSAMAHQFNVSNEFPAILVLSGAAVGVIVAWYQPGNPMGWILLVAMGCVAASDDASFYSVADYRLHHGTLPLGWVAVLLQPAWAPAIVLWGWPSCCFLTAAAVTALAVGSEGLPGRGRVVDL
jgi:hypothetical protein